MSIFSVLNYYQLF